jgi:hypothetical protein
MVKSHRELTEYFSIAETEFIPLVREGKQAQAMTVLRDKLTPIYDRHYKLVLEGWQRHQPD